MYAPQIAIALIALIFFPARSAHQSGQTAARAETCQTAPERLEGGAIHILRVEALSSQSTDVGTNQIQ